MGEESSGMMGMFKGENGILNLMLVVAFVGSIASQYAPGLLAPLGGIIGKPLDSILYVYTLTFFMYTLVGEEKDAGEILKKLMPILMVVIIAGSFFDTGVDTSKYLMLIIAAPLLGKAARNLVQGGAFKLAAKWTDKKKHGKWKDFFEELGGEKKDKDKDKDKSMFFFESPRLMGTIYHHLVELKGRVKAFNTAKSDFEGSVKNLAKVFKVHVDKGSAGIMLPSTTTKPEFDAVKFTKTLGGDKDFEAIVKELDKNVDKVLKVAAPPLSPILLLDAALAAALHFPDILAIKADIEAKRTALEAASGLVEESFRHVTAAYDVTGMLTLKSEDIKKEIESTKELLDETKKIKDEVKKILGKVL